MCHWKWLLVCYDIKSTKRRTQLVKKLESIGLARLQYSVFGGWVKTTTERELTNYLKKWINIDEVERALIIPCTKTRIRDNIVIGKQLGLTDPFEHPDEWWKTHIIV